MNEFELGSEISGIPSDMFFGNEIKEKSESEHKDISRDTEFFEKGENRSIGNIKYDIKFTMGSETFENIVLFLGEMGYDVIMRFSKEGIKLYIFDITTTHAAHVVIDKTEIADYVVEGLTEELSEKVVYVDMSVVNEMVINKDCPVDFYVDTASEKRFYVVNGKFIESKRLNSMNDELNATLQSYKKGYDRLLTTIANPAFQKIIVNQTALKNVLMYLSKKGGSSKEVKLVNVILKKDFVDFRVRDDSREKFGSGILSGEDCAVYPIKEDEVELNLEYFKKFSKLKLTHKCALYVSSVLPFIFETRLGAGRTIVYYLLAPRRKTG